MVRALARSVLWQKMLDEGVCESIGELSKLEKVNRGYMRALQLTLLAPDIVEAVLDGRQPEGTRLKDLLNGFPFMGAVTTMVGRCLGCGLPGPV